MTYKQALKKPAIVVVEDWHVADIIAALRKKGWSLDQLGFNCTPQYKRGVLALALHKPYPKAEGIIAQALGVDPKMIWPTRYNADGTSNRKKGAKPRRPAHIEFTSPTKAGNTQRKQAA